MNLSVTVSFLGKPTSNRNRDKEVVSLRCKHSSTCFKNSPLPSSLLLLPPEAPSPSPSETSAFCLPHIGVKTEGQCFRNQDTSIKLQIFNFLSKIRTEQLVILGAYLHLITGYSG
jgi:hypothetical protein